MNIKEQHKKEVTILGELENDIIKLVANTGNYILIDKFSKWQEQRRKCNGLFLEHIIELSKL